MERDALLCVMLPLLCWPAVVAIAFVRRPPGPPQETEDAERAEQLSWRGLWIGVLPGACAAALLIGWALVEPDPSDETLGGGRLLVSALCLLPFLRAGVRSCIAAARPIRLPAIGTVGLIRPRIVVDPAFASAVAPLVLAAAVAHEQAHVVNRDPLRLWLAQIGTDLQWPAPAAPRRLERWRQVLEWARDDDARRAGVTGEDLAAAILAAVRRHQGVRVDGVALARTGEDLRTRVQRLLSTPPARVAVPPASRWPLAALLGAVFVGVVWGEPVVRFLVGSR